MVASGVRIVDSDGNHVGNRNVITGNAADGVTVVSGVDNAIQQNTIRANGDLGIDLAPDGVTANDPLDADTGANRLQNHPVLGLATSTGLPFTLDAAPSRRYRVELHSSATCDGGGAHARAAEVTTDALGHATGTFVALRLPGSPARYYTATATALRSLGASPVWTPADTSEFSACPGCREALLRSSISGLRACGWLRPGACRARGRRVPSGRAVLVTPWMIPALATVGPGNRDPEVCDARDAFGVGRGDVAR